MIPDTLKFLIVIALIVGSAFGAIWGLAHFPPEQSEVVRNLPSDKLRLN